MHAMPEAGPVVLHRCDRFVARTTNWLYDHLRCVPAYVPIVVCDALENREEFPELQALCWDPENLARHIWRRVAGQRLYPADRVRLRRLRPRVLHSHFGYVAVEDSQVQQFLDVPWVISFYGADVYQLGRLEKWRQTYLRLFEEVTRVLALGPAMAGHLENLGCPHEKITVHPLGVDCDTLPSEPREFVRGQRMRILFAGTFREKKGIQYLIRAVALVRRAGVRLELHLVGDEMGKPGDRETKEAVFREIRCLGLEDVVIHYPFLTFKELIGLALRSHVFAAPSVTALDGDAEGTPFVLQQMMATGMPAIATLHSDIPYLFGEHKHLLVPEHDAYAIAQRLQRYAEEPATLVTDGIAVRDRIRSAFDVRKCAAGLSDLYDTVRCAHAA